MIFKFLLCLCFSRVTLSLPVEPFLPEENPRQLAASAKDFPYQILISQFDESPKCSGVLIADRFILTSATCVLDFGGIKKFLEEAILYGGGTSLLVDLGDVSDAVIHPKYTVNPTAYDVALVKYHPDEKGPKLNSTAFNGTWINQAACIFTTWWNEPDSWPERLLWQPVSLTECTPVDPNMSCLAENIPPFNQNDLGSPIVCDGLLTGMVPRGGGFKVMNLTSDYDWIMEAMLELKEDEEDLPDEEDEDDTKLYLVKILQKLDFLTDGKTKPDNFTNWNNQIVIPLSYVLFAMVIFFFVLLFFIVLFTVVLVYYSRK